jgi:hypothetical protein
MNDRANSRLSPRLEASVEAPPQLTMDETGYVIARHAHESFKPFRYRKPVFYIPSLPATVQPWFAVDAISGTGKHELQSFLLFVRQNPGRMWKLESSPASATGGILPVALSRARAATALPAGDPELAVAPSQLPALHAGLINGKSLRAGFAMGRWTGTLIRTIKSARRLYGKSGWKYHDHWATTSAPVYSLRSNDGGAIVWYFLTDQQSGVRTSAGRPLQSGTVIGALTGKSHITHRYTITSVDEFVAVIPPKGKGKIVIEGGNTANVAATNP